MEEKINQKPCVVQKIETSQGFSVSYKEHFLYSKYNPSKNIITAVENLQLLPGTIILCCSPLLGYGLSELTKKLPENCLIILCEKEQALYDFSASEGSFTQNDERIKSYSFDTLFYLPAVIINLAKSGLYKRVIRLDMSAGIQFNKDFYDNLYKSCTDALMVFWKNRLTLTKFGRRYSRNLFENLHYLGNSRPISDFTRKVTKPIIVFGAGQSTQTFLDKNKILRDNYFILCADTALQPLLKNGIKPDGVFIEEAQSVIIKAFIGVPDDIQIFAGLSSIPNITHKFKTNKISYFLTAYTNADFINDLIKKNFIPQWNMPMGSVGLTAVYYALLFRKDESVPVFVTGLDFSYSSGITHTKGALAHIVRLFTTHRLNPIENYNSAFGIATEKIIDKSGKTFTTIPTLKSYAEMFNEWFGKTKNIFDAGESGIPLAIQRAVPEASDKQDLQLNNTSFSDNQKSELQNYLNNEKNSLEYLRDLLTGKTDFIGEKLSEEIKKIAEPREYLYLHFADGWKFSNSQSFLNRIRTEIDFFLKYI